MPPADDPAHDDELAATLAELVEMLEARRRGIVDDRGDAEARTVAGEIPGVPEDARGEKDVQAEAPETRPTATRRPVRPLRRHPARYFPPAPELDVGTKAAESRPPAVEPNEQPHDAVAPALDRPTDEQRPSNSTATVPLMLTAGPFADPADVTSFETRLAALPGVGGVRSRSGALDASRFVLDVELDQLDLRPLLDAGLKLRAASAGSVELRGVDAAPPHPAGSDQSSQT